MSTFSRKFYEQTAKILKDSFGGPNQPTNRIEVAVRFSDVFAEDNERFDRTRFYLACGIGEDERLELSGK